MSSSDVAESSSDSCMTFSKEGRSPMAPGRQWLQRYSDASSSSTSSEEDPWRLHERLANKLKERLAASQQLRQFPCHPPTPKRRPRVQKPPPPQHHYRSCNPSPYPQSPYNVRSPHSGSPPRDPSYCQPPCHSCYRPHRSQSQHVYSYERPAPPQPPWADPNLLYTAALMMASQQGSKRHRRTKPKRKHTRRGRKQLRRRREVVESSSQSNSSASEASSIEPVRRRSEQRGKSKTEKTIVTLIESLKQVLKENAEAYGQTKAKHEELLNMLKEQPQMKETSLEDIPCNRSVVSMASAPVLTPTPSDVSSHLVRVSMPPEGMPSAALSAVEAKPYVAPPSSRSTASGFTDFSALRGFRTPPGRGPNPVNNNAALKMELANRERERKKVKLQTLQGRLRQIETEIAAWMARFKANNGGQPPTKVNM